MKDILVILTIADLPIARHISAELEDYEVYLFDAGLADPAAASGLRNVELFTTLGGPSFHAMDRQAHSLALDLETHLDTLRRRHREMSIVGWQHLNLYYSFMTLEWYGALWERTELKKAGPRRVHLFINDRPAEYYFESFLPAVLLMSYLQKHGIEFIAYRHGAKGTPAYPIPDFPGIAAADVSGRVLTHLPTCFYDIDFYCDELRAAGKSTINLEAKLWNVPTATDRQIGLTDPERVLARLAPAQREEVAVLARELYHALDLRLAPHIDLPDYRARQVDHIVQLYRSQLLLYFELQRYFGNAAPAKLVLSEHDAGFHGPLIAFAEQRSLPVVLLPHSKVSGDIEFTYENIVVLCHPLQGQPIHDGVRRRVPYRAVLYPERFTGTSAVGHGMRTVSLMLNAPSLNGVPYVATDVYLDGIKRIVTWCRDHGINVKIRCRPGHAVVRVLSAYLGVDPDTLGRNVAESMEDHVRGCDLCLMYDMPTTAALHFLRTAVAILNPVTSVPTTAFLAIAHPEVIVTESVEATLERLEAFRSDPLTLYAFAASQFQAYLAKFQRARALRTFF